MEKCCEIYSRTSRISSAKVCSTSATDHQYRGSPRKILHDSSPASTSNIIFDCRSLRLDENEFCQGERERNINLRCASSGEI
ncbi:hypothetical protein TIFTF001_016553 [Ficus carica]|uniref:Uncharacterized protein n=1 Tax=Ficus carica TaxID=3494 RepID=A0AA88AAP1_FICCA|nr:hypothetical protein TIFTF001_016553 [Ficus carica]